MSDISHDSPLRIKQFLKL